MEIALAVGLFSITGGACTFLQRIGFKNNLAFLLMCMLASEAWILILM